VLANKEGTIPKVQPNAAKDVKQDRSEALFSTITIEYSGHQVFYTANYLLNIHYIYLSLNTFLI
jgi:hypothetical protein